MRWRHSELSGQLPTTHHSPPTGHRPLGHTERGIASEGPLILDIKWHTMHLAESI